MATYITIKGSGLWPVVSVFLSGHLIYIFWTTHLLTHNWLHYLTCRKWCNYYIHIWAIYIFRKCLNDFPLSWWYGNRNQIYVNEFVTRFCGIINHMIRLIRNIYIFNLGKENISELIFNRNQLSSQSKE